MSSNCDQKYKPVILIEKLHRSANLITAVSITILTKEIFSPIKRVLVFRVRMRAQICVHRRKWSIIFRLLWLIILLVASLLFLYMLYNNIVKLTTYPVSVDVQDMYFDELEFPAVTVCNENKFR